MEEFINHYQNATKESRELSVKLFKSLDTNEKKHVKHIIENKEYELFEGAELFRYEKHVASKIYDACFLDIYDESFDEYTMYDILYICIEYSSVHKIIEHYKHTFDIQKIIRECDYMIYMNACKYSFDNLIFLEKNFEIKYNARNDNAIVYACSTPDNNDTIDFLIKKGLNIYRKKNAIKNLILSSSQDTIQKYLTTKIPPNVTVDFNYIFNRLCSKGYIQTAQYFYKHYTSKIDITSEEYYAFRKSICNGHTDVVSWIYELFPNIDNYVSKKGSLKMAICNGYIECVKYVIERNGNHDYDFVDTSVINMVALDNNISVLKFICEDVRKGTLTEEEVNTIIRICSEHNHIDILKYIETIVVLSPTQIHNCYIRSISFGNVDIVRHIINKYEIIVKKNETTEAYDKEQFEKELFKYYKSYNLDKIKELLQNTNFSFDNVTLLKCAFVDNKTSIAMYLFDTISENHIHKKDFINESSVFQNCCMNGNIELVKWFLQKFETDTYIVNKAFFISMSYGHYILCKWISENYEIRYDTIFSKVFSFNYLERSHIYIFKLINKKTLLYFLTDEEKICDIIINVCTNGYGEAFTFFIEKIKDKPIFNEKFMYMCYSHAISCYQFSSFIVCYILDWFLQNGSIESIKNIIMMSIQNNIGIIFDHPLYEKIQSHISIQSYMSFLYMGIHCQIDEIYVNKMIDCIQDEQLLNTICEFIQNDGATPFYKQSYLKIVFGKADVFLQKKIIYYCIRENYYYFLDWCQIYWPKYNIHKENNIYIFDDYILHMIRKQDFVPICQELNISIKNEKHQPDTCSICIESNANVKTNCHHMYCIQCFLEFYYIYGNNKCGICRQKIESSHTTFFLQ